MHSATLITAFFGALASAHLFISSPSPIPGSNSKSPLNADGSNFPCQGATLPTSGGQAMAAGSQQLLAWDTGDGANTAVHGGGSCQMSITYETDADAVKDPKNWYVIYSIEGGCPSNTHLNLDGSFPDPSGSGTYTGSWPCTNTSTNGVDCVNQFDFTIPKGVKDGHAIMAWTWFNTVGNREIYMNCINTELSGGDGSEMDEFPTMFVANLQNIDGGQCPTTEGVNVGFPNPGKYVTTKMPSGEAAQTATHYPISTPTGSGCAGDGGSASGGSAASTADGGASSSPSTPTSSAAPAETQPAYAQSASPSQQTSSQASSNPPVTVTTMATVTSGSGNASAPNAPAAGTAAPSGYVSPSSGGSPSSSGSTPNTGAGSSANSNGTSSGDCTNGAVFCPTPGSVVCIGNSQFGLCDINNCAVPQALAAGTQCSGGTISRKRSVHQHVRKHVAGRLSF